jgi:hypothetical protein
MIRRGDVRYLLLEGLVVLFGVLIALVVDGVRERAIQHAAADAAVARVILEVQQNLSEFQDLEVVVEERLSRLRALGSSPTASAGLSDLVDRFGGYRSPDLSEAAWLRLSGSDLADVVDQTFLTDAFHLYEWNRQYDQLDGEITGLVYSELFYLPSRTSIAIRMSGKLMEQQLSWAAQLIPEYQMFLERFDGERP